MSKDLSFTYNYFQPSHYRFSMDSVILAKKIAQLVQKRQLNPLNALDLCAGCGVIGFEFYYFNPQIIEMDFLEVQEVYLEYFLKNREMVCQNNKNIINNFNFLNLNYNKLLTEKFLEKYDLILCNPPYFFKNEGLLSPNEFKNRCRFFLDSDFETLIKSCLYSLKLGGSAFLLIRDGTDHKRSPLLVIKKLVSTYGEVSVLENIRGTDIIEIKRIKHGN